MSSVQKRLVEFLDMPVVNIDRGRDKGRHGQEPELNCYYCSRKGNCERFQKLVILSGQLRDMEQLKLDTDITRAKEEYKHLKWELERIRRTVQQCLEIEIGR